MDLQVVHVRINDAASGQPTPVRIRFVDATGRYRAPLGRPEHFPTGFGQQVGGNVEIEGRKYAYIDGTCEILLPTGPIQVEVHKGVEYAPVFHTFNRATGQISLRLSIERKFNLEAEGWYAGDVCAHFLSPQAAWLEGAAEGLHVVNLLAAEWEDEHGRPYHSNLLDFTGLQEPAKKDGTLVSVGTLNRGGDQGDFALLNCHRIVYPLRLGQEGFENYTALDWCRQCHRKGGLVVGTRFPSDPTLQVPPQNWPVNAFAWLAATPSIQEQLPQWYASLIKRHGVNLALVGGSGKTSNGVALGAVRTYVCTASNDKPKDVSYERWIRGIGLRATFVTRGPLLDFTVGSRRPPGEIPAAGSCRTRQVYASARSVTPYQRLDVLCNGAVIAQAAPSPDGIAVVEQPWNFSTTSWLVARCWGTGGELLAHTSPAWVRSV